MITSISGPTPLGLYATTDAATGTIPVDLPTNTWRTLYRIVAPATAGDTLDVEARARVTNDVGYTVGVGAHLWIYDVDDGLGSAGVWTKIAPSWGDNVSPDRHHMPIAVTALWQVPDTWPDGHRIAIVLRADAHSTAWQPGDTLTVDQDYGQLAVRRWGQEAAA